MSGVEQALETRARVRSFALGLPEAYEDFPWGESVAKVNGRVFVFLGSGDAELPVGIVLKPRLPAPNRPGTGWVVPAGCGCPWTSTPLPRRTC